MVPQPRPVAGFGLVRSVDEAPLMLIPGHSLRPLSEHALLEGSLELGLRNEASLAASPSLQRSTTLRTRRSMFQSQKSKRPAPTSFKDL